MEIYVFQSSQPNAQNEFSEDLYKRRQVFMLFKEKLR
jgi:hypothetical protein